MGSLVGTIVDNYTSPILGRASYQIPLGIIYIIPAFIFLGLFFIPESPRWLVQHGQVDKARKSLEWLRPHKEGIEAEIKEIQHSIEVDEQRGKSVAIMDLFRDPIDRRRTILSVAAVTTQAGCGAMYMIGKWGATDEQQHQ